MNPHRFACGTNRIFYKAKDFEVGIIVTARLWYPDVFAVRDISFIELEHGVYYGDIDFIAPGLYCLIMFEGISPPIPIMMDTISVVETKNHKDKLFLDKAVVIGG